MDKVFRDADRVAREIEADGIISNNVVSESPFTFSSRLDDIDEVREPFIVTNYVLADTCYGVRRDSDESVENYRDMIGVMANAKAQGKTVVANHDFANHLDEFDVYDVDDPLLPEESTIEEFTDFVEEYTEKFQEFYSQNCSEGWNDLDCKLNVDDRKYEQTVLGTGGTAITYDSDWTRSQALATTPKTANNLLASSHLQSE